MKENYWEKRSMIGIQEKKDPTTIVSGSDKYKYVLDHNRMWLRHDPCYAVATIWVIHSLRRKK
jgi:hypothetical protein